MSECFEKAFTSGMTGCERECECGRVHFDIHNVWDWEDGELERLKANAKAMPERYIAHDYSIGSVIIDGKDVIAECPCGLAQKYEKFIIKNKYAIARYLNIQAELLRTEAEQITVKGEGK